MTLSPTALSIYSILFFFFFIHSHLLSFFINYSVPGRSDLQTLIEILNQRIANPITLIEILNTN